MTVVLFPCFTLSMNGFRIGFVAAFSFLLVVAVFSGTLGYFPPPEGPKAPEYPTYTDYPLGAQAPNILNQNQVQQFNDLQPIESDYEKAVREYNEERKKYEEEQASFVDEKIVPYARNIFIAWISLQTLFVLIGLFFIKINSELVGSGFAFSSVWTILFLPLGGIIWYANLIISSFALKAEETYSADPILQAVMWSSIFGVVLLTIFGNLLYGVIRFPKSNNQIPQQNNGVQ